MALIPGTRLGPHEIVALLGVGGMGEVYRARDTRLQRDVALKLLPSSVAADHDSLARFTREAQLLATLNHPHIASIYGVEESDSGAALVLELVEGPTLADRIAQGPIALDEAIAIGRQITEALEAAHEQGIIHRDLKPANIKLRPDGTVKVLDFGLAKTMLSPSTSGVGALDITASPTFTAHATAAGLILGTAAYMAPEQARGRAMDRRADIWAFGVVLFEMLTGVRPFGGETMSETLAAIIKDPPSWTALPPSLPAPLQALIKRTLEKDPRRRLRDIGDARLTLEDLESGADTPAIAPVAAHTEHLSGKVLVFADESTWGGDPRAVDKLKGMVTESTVPIERKFLPLVEEPSALHIIIASNNEWPVSIPVDDRRFMVLEVDDSQRQNDAYFEPLRTELENGGLAAVLHDLLNHDTDLHALRHPPSTAGKRDLTLRSLTPIQRWWFEKLQAGGFVKRKRDEHSEWTEFEEWPVEIQKDELHNDYLQFLDKHHRVSRERRATETELGQFLQKHVPQLGQQRRLIEGKRQRFWSLHTLNVCRAEWVRACHWPENYPWDE